MLYFAANSIIMHTYTIRHTDEKLHDWILSISKNDDRSYNKVILKILKEQYKKQSAIKEKKQ